MYNQFLKAFIRNKKIRNIYILLFFFIILFFVFVILSSNFANYKINKLLNSKENREILIESMNIDFSKDIDIINKLSNIEIIKYRFFLKTYNTVKGFDEIVSYDIDKVEVVNENDYAVYIPNTRDEKEITFYFENTQLTVKNIYYYDDIYKSNQLYVNYKLSEYLLKNVDVDLFFINIIADDYKKVDSVLQDLSDNNISASKNGNIDEMTTYYQTFQSRVVVFSFIGFIVAILFAIYVVIQMYKKQKKDMFLLTSIGYSKEIIRTIYLYETSILIMIAYSLFLIVYLFGNILYTIFYPLFIQISERFEQLYELIHYNYIYLFYPLFIVLMINYICSFTFFFLKRKKIK